MKWQVNKCSHLSYTGFFSNTFHLVLHILIVVHNLKKMISEFAIIRTLSWPDKCEWKHISKSHFSETSFILMLTSPPLCVSCSKYTRGELIELLIYWHNQCMKCCYCYLILPADIVGKYTKLFDIWWRNYHSSAEILVE